MDETFLKLKYPALEFTLDSLKSLPAKVVDELYNHVFYPNFDEHRACTTHNFKITYLILADKSGAEPNRYMQKLKSLLIEYHANN